MALTKEDLAEIQGMVLKAAEAVEGQLFASLEKTIASLNEKVASGVAAAADLQIKAKAAFDTIPQMIEGHVENKLQVNLKGFFDDLESRFEEKIKTLGGGTGADGGGLSLEKLLNKADKIVEVVNAFRSPTTEQAMLGQMNFVMKWHSLLSKFERGGGTGEEFTKTIAETFATPAQE